MVINPDLYPLLTPMNSTISANLQNIACFAFYEAANKWLSEFQSLTTKDKVLGILFQDLANDYWHLLGDFPYFELERNIRPVQIETFCRVRRYIENFYKLKNLTNDPDFLLVINAKENNKEKDERFPDKYEKHKDPNGFLTLRGLGECLRANDEGIIKDFDSDVLFEVECINGKIGDSLYSVNQKNYITVDGKSILHPIDILSGIAKTANPYVHGGKIWIGFADIDKLHDQIKGIFYMCLECLHIALKEMMKLRPLSFNNTPYCSYKPNYIIEDLYERQKEIIKTKLFCYQYN